MEQIKFVNRDTTVPQCGGFYQQKSILSPFGSKMSKIKGSAGPHAPSKVSRGRAFPIFSGP